MFLLTSFGTYIFIYFLFGLEDLLDYNLFEQQSLYYYLFALEGLSNGFDSKTQR
jgi:hypothetical protein